MEADEPKVISKVLLKDKEIRTIPKADVCGRNEAPFEVPLTMHNAFIRICGRALSKIKPIV